MDGKPPAWVYGRPYMPPLRVQWEFVGVDVLIDPSAQAAIGRRADVGIRPYRCSAPSILGVGVDALIDPTAKRPKGRRADVGIRPYGVRRNNYNLLLMLAMMSRMVSFRGFLLSDNAFSIFRTECRTVE